MNSRNGSNLGNTVMHRLRNLYNFTVEKNDDWEAKNFIDFVVFYIPNLQRIQSTGVQITSKLDDSASMGEFLNINTGEGRLVDRILYIEIDPSLQLDGPGGDMVSFVIRQFQMDRSWQGLDAAGARLFGNMTYEIFNLRDHAQPGRRRDTAAMPAQTAASGSSSATPASAAPASGDPSELVRALQHRRTQIGG